MLFGLTVLASNLQGLLGKLLQSLLLFWERASMRSLLAKNIAAHRSRNQLTANIYSLTLGCIIFLITSSNIQIESISAMSSFSGADIVVSIEDKNESKDALFAAQVDPVLSEKAALIKEWAYVTQELRHSLPGEGDTCLVEDKAQRNAQTTVSLWGLSPSEQIDKNLASDFSSNRYFGETQ